MLGVFLITMAMLSLRKLEISSRQKLKVLKKKVF